MSERVVIVDSEEIAARGAELFPNATVLYANGTLPPEALTYSDAMIFSKDLDRITTFGLAFAAAQCKLIRFANADISMFDRAAILAMNKAGQIRPFKAPEPLKPDVNALLSEVASEDRSERAQADASHDWTQDIPEAPETILRTARNASALKRAAHENAEPAEWPEPQDLWNSRPLPRFNPAWVLPCLRAVSENNAAMVGCDQGIDYLQRIAFAAGCLDDAIKVRVRPTQDWTESARIWACVLGDSGDGKSPSMAGISGPSRDLRFEIAERSKEKFAKWKAECEVYELDRKAWVLKRHKGEPVGPLPIAPPRPVNELLYFSSTTAEGLLEQQEQSTRGTMLEADEVLGWAAGMDQYKAGGKGSDKAFWLSSWNGAEYVGILVGKLRTIHNTGVTIIGGTQPSAIRLAMAKANFTTEDGLVQRFLFHVSSGLASEDSEQPADRAAIGRWKNIVHRLYAMRPNLQPCEFSPEAHAIRQRMNEWIAKLRGIQSIPAAERQALAKWSAYFSRIAITLHAIEAADTGCDVIPAIIEEHIADLVFRYMTESLWPSLEHFYSEALENTEDMRSLKSFADYVLARDKRMVITTELGRNWSHYRNLKSINLRREFWSSVVMSGWARPLGMIARNEGIYSRYEVNPLAFDGRFSERAAQAKVAAQMYRDAMPAGMLQAREPGED